MSQSIQNSIGRLSPTAVHDRLIDKTVEFIWECLTPWRNDPERIWVEAEEDLNAQFHNFIQARATSDFPMVMFQHEQRQEGQRRVDISVKPTSPTIIEGRRYSHYDPFIVIEGKRLPAPSKSREREYVTGVDKISGGIQRFKEGLHGKEHDLAIILGYLQDGEATSWLTAINSWIADLSKSDAKKWKSSESLGNFQNSNPRYRMVSTHGRSKGCQSQSIQLLHFWVQFS
jgi:hypothetical protein